MEEKEKNQETDNIYIYSEEEYVESAADLETDAKEQSSEAEDSDPDTSNLNYSQYVLDDVEYSQGEPDGDNERSKNNVSIFGLMIKTLISPLEGWKSLRRYSITPEEAQRECFYPLLALYSAGKFVRLAYSAKAEISSLIVEAVGSFVAFFLGYFCILLLLNIIMPTGTKKILETDFGKTFVIISLSTLCFFFLLMELLPMLWAVLIFLPLWTVYIICRGERFFKFPENNRLLYTGLLNMGIIGVPIVIEWALDKILPKF